MKYFIITLGLLLIGGCSNIREQPQYIGTLPAYANKAPHPVNCACCSLVTILEVGEGGVMKEFRVTQKDFQLWIQNPSSVSLYAR